MIPFLMIDVVQDLFYRLITVSLVWGYATGYHLVIYRRGGKKFKYLADGVNVCTFIGLLTSQLFWGGIAIGAPLGIGEGVGIAAAEVDEFDVIVNAGQQDIVGFEVKMQHLIAVQIAYGIQQLTQEFVCMILVPKIRN